VLLAVLLVAACSGDKEKPKPKPPVPVSAATAVRKTVPVQIRVIGNVEAYATVSIKAQVNGMIEKVHFREGQDVKKGQLLFSLDSRPFAAVLRQARAALARDAAQERFAREQVRRYGQLLNDGIVTRDQYDQLRANADALGETVQADRALIDTARIQLGFCSIRSPIDGRTGNLLVQQGNLVKANDVPVLVIINQVNPLYVTFSVPEKELTEIRRYMADGQLRVDALIPHGDGPAEQGLVSFIDNMVDATTGTIKIKGTFANRERRLWPGQFVDVALTLTSLPDVVVVPAPAVQTGQSGQFVFVVKTDRSVAVRPVVTGENYQGEVVIVKGIAPGETVVTDGQMQLVPGAKVQIKSAQPVSQAPRP
jgi:multidrug efflux system membrane fusion protein